MADNSTRRTDPRGPAGAVDTGGQAGAIAHGVRIVIDLRLPVHLAKKPSAFVSGQTGAALSMPAFEATNTYAVEIDGDDVFVERPF